MGEGRDFGLDVVGDRVDDGAGVEVDRSASPPHNPGTFGRRELAVHVERAAEVHDESRRDTTRTLRSGSVVRRSPGPDLGKVAVTPRGDAADDLAARDQRVDEVAVVASPCLDLEAGQSGRLDGQPAAVVRWCDVAGPTP
jgi:hypothetical protein